MGYLYDVLFGVKKSKNMDELFVRNNISLQELRNLEQRGLRACQEIFEVTKLIEEMDRGSGNADKIRIPLVEVIDGIGVYFKNRGLKPGDSTCH